MFYQRVSNGALDWAGFRNFWVKSALVQVKSTDSSFRGPQGHSQRLARSLRGQRLQWLYYLLFLMSPTCVHIQFSSWVAPHQPPPTQTPQLQPSDFGILRRGPPERSPFRLFPISSCIYLSSYLSIHPFVRVSGSTPTPWSGPFWDHGLRPWSQSPSEHRKRYK